MNETELVDVQFVHIPIQHTINTKFTVFIIQSSRVMGSILKEWLQYTNCNCREKSCNANFKVMHKTPTQYFHYIYILNPHNKRIQPKLLCPRKHMISL